MRKEEQLSSTEKLLDLIRGKNQASLEKQPEAVFIKKNKIRAFSFFKLKKLKYKKDIKVVIGVNILYKDIIFVKILHLANNEFKLLDYEKVSLPFNITKNSPEFPKLLQDALTQFCGAKKNINIWTNIASTQVDTRYIKIPKTNSKNISKAAFWSYKKEVNFKEDETIFDFEIIGDIKDKKGVKTGLLAYTAPKNEIKKTRELFEKIGFPLTGISIIVFSFQNFLRSQWFSKDLKEVCILFIGKDWSRIDIFSDSHLILSRDIRTGISSILNEISEEYTNNDIEKAKDILDSLVNDNYGQVSKKRLFEIISPVIERLLRQIERTFEYYITNFNAKRSQIIYISGGACKFRALLQYIGEQLEIPIESIDPFKSCQSQESGIVDYEKNDLFVPAFGLSLSDNSYTPNFLFTYKHKAFFKVMTRVNQLLVISFLVLLFILSGIFISVKLDVYKKNDILGNIQQKINTYTPYVDKNKITDLISQMESNKKLIDQYVKRYKSVAIIKEIPEKTPKAIYLLNIKSVLYNIEDKKKNDKDNKYNKKVVLEGVVMTDENSFEAVLADYLIKLKNSLLFSEVLLQYKNIIDFKDKKVLHFAVEIKIT